MKRETFADEWRPRILSVLRLVTALLFLQHPKTATRCQVASARNSSCTSQGRDTHIKTNRG